MAHAPKRSELPVVDLSRASHDKESLKTSLAVQRPVRCSDLLGILGILLPLPCTVLLAEELLAAQETEETEVRGWSL